MHGSSIPPSAFCQCVHPSLAVFFRSYSRHLCTFNSLVQSHSRPPLILFCAVFFRSHSHPPLILLCRDSTHIHLQFSCAVFFRSHSRAAQLPEREGADLHCSLWWRTSYRLQLLQNPPRNQEVQERGGSARCSVHQARHECALFLGHQPLNCKL